MEKQKKKKMGWWSVKSRLLGVCHRSDVTIATVARVMSLQHSTSDVNANGKKKSPWRYVVLVWAPCRSFLSTGPSNYLVRKGSNATICIFNPKLSACVYKNLTMECLQLKPGFWVFFFNIVKDTCTWLSHSSSYFCLRLPATFSNKFSWFKFPKYNQTNHLI